MAQSLATVVKHLTFDAAHYLVNKNLSKEENIKTFHKCCLYKEEGVEEPHGHTYHLEVAVTGFISEETGYVIDFKDLKLILKEGVIENLDHRLINNITWFKENNKLATVENILHYVWEEIQSKIDSIRPNKAWLYEIKMYETPTSFATLNRKQWNQERLTLDNDNFLTAEHIINQFEAKKDIYKENI